MNRFEQSLVFECAFAYMNMEQKTIVSKRTFWLNRFLPLKRALDNAIGETTIFTIVHDTIIYIYGGRELLYKIDTSNGWEIRKF